MNRDLYIKEDVLLRPEHFLFLPVGLILKAASVCYPPDYPLWITRGAEPVEGGAVNSKHLICCAFDFRTRHLAPEINRNEIVERMQKGLGPMYYLYYKKTVRAEWIHCQYNGGK